MEKARASVNVPIWLLLVAASLIGAAIGGVAVFVAMESRTALQAEPAASAAVAPSSQSPSPRSATPLASETSRAPSVTPRPVVSSPSPHPKPAPPTGIMTVTAGHSSGYRNCTTWNVQVVNDSNTPIVRFTWAPGSGSYLTDGPTVSAKAPPPKRQSLYLKPGAARQFSYQMCTSTPYPEGVNILEFGDTPPRSVAFTWATGTKGVGPVTVP